METSTAAPILIVGGGVAGLGLAWALSRTGWRSITVLEREEQPFRVSSGQNAAILRTAQSGTLSAMTILRELPTTFVVELGGPPTQR